MTYGGNPLGEVDLMSDTMKEEREKDQRTVKYKILDLQRAA